MKYLPTSRIGFFVVCTRPAEDIRADRVRSSQAERKEWHRGVVSAGAWETSQIPLPFHELQRASSVIVVYRCLPRSPKPRYLSHRLSFSSQLSHSSSRLLPSCMGSPACSLPCPEQHPRVFLPTHWNISTPNPLMCPYALVPHARLRSPIQYSISFLA